MRKFLFSALAIMLLVGCAATRTQTPVAIYDFGLQRLSDAPNAYDTSRQPRLSGSLSVAVTSPTWLDSPAIQYRLAYHDLARSYIYASNRWAAGPATLLTQRIKTRIAAGSNGGVVTASDGVQANYVLRLDLEEFTQVFNTTDQSHALVRMRASLIDRGTRLLLAQRSFSMEHAAPTPNAAGAVHALTEASDKLIDNLIDWLAEKLPEETNGGKW